MNKAKSRNEGVAFRLRSRQSQPDGWSNMSFFRPVYASNGTAYGDPIKGTGKDGDHLSYYESLSQNPTRSGLYHSAYSHRGLNQVRC